MRKTAKTINDIKGLEFVSLPELAILSGLNYVQLRKVSEKLPKLEGTIRYHKARSLQILADMAKPSKQR